MTISPRSRYSINPLFFSTLRRHGRAKENLWNGEEEKQRVGVNNFDTGHIATSYYNRQIDRKCAREAATSIDGYQTANWRKRFLINHSYYYRTSDLHRFVGKN